MTRDEEEAAERHDAMWGLSIAGCPHADIPGRIELMLPYLSVVDGKVVVTGGALVPAGHKWVISEESDGKPRTCFNHDGSGVDSPYPLARLIEDLQLAHPYFRWPR